jgi:hypothetical protein
MSRTGFAHLPLHGAGARRATYDMTIEVMGKSLNACRTSAARFSLTVRRVTGKLLRPH